MEKRCGHLSQTEIREIITSYLNGEKKLSIANRIGVDNSTVHYHIQKYERSYPEQTSVYALIRTDMRKVCAHPSKKCLVCGKAEDAVKRDDVVQIRTLTARLKRANERLEQAGLPVE